MYANLKECLNDLEQNGQLVRIKESIDPNLEMAAVHLRIHEAGGPALLFENVQGSRYQAASNIFGTIDRCHFLFRHSKEKIRQLMLLSNNPAKALKQPVKHLPTAMNALKALPTKKSFLGFQEIKISDLPQIKHWPEDGGAFVTLPQVYSEDVSNKGIMRANIGMYRIQLSGNDYLLDKEIGLHYQIHRGIGVHQSKALAEGKALKVSIFVGGPPAHTLAAVMPLPEGLSEAVFAGILGGRRFRYSYDSNGFAVSNDADFVITGTIIPETLKYEGPFGDHLGYYSLKHPFPVLKIHKVYAKPQGIWNFTVVGRPPQEDSTFGAFIHELTGDALKKEIPGLKALNAVDEAGVHPLLLAIGSERYTPYLPQQQPAELLTIANRILGTGQLSLAKYLWIAADDSQQLSVKNIPDFMQYVLERIDWRRDVHFQTNTTIDTLDYSGGQLNQGSKVVLAACGHVKRSLRKEVPVFFKELQYFDNPQMVIPGILALQAPVFKDYEKAKLEMEALSDMLMVAGEDEALESIPLLIITDDADFLAADFKNYLWITYTRSNPAMDIYGVNSFTDHKHWGCKHSLIIDARKKPHHAPELIKSPEVEQKIDRLFEKGGSLYAYRQ